MTNNLRRIAKAFPRCQNLINSINIANGFTAKQVAEYKREIKLELFKVLDKPMYMNRVVFKDSETLAAIFLFRKTTKGDHYWYGVADSIDRVIYK